MRQGMKAALACALCLVVGWVAGDVAEVPSEPSPWPSVELPDAMKPDPLPRAGLAADDGYVDDRRISVCETPDGGG